MAQRYFVNRSSKIILNLLGACLVLAAQLFSPQHARAANGFPNTLKFGYGARLDPLGNEVSLALNTATSIGIDWVGMDFDWARLWANSNKQPKLDTLDEAIGRAHKNRVNVLLSITNPPSWALNDKGPDPELTAGLVSQLADRYRDSVLAIELLPEANTRRGWGARPNPQAYAALLAACWEGLRSHGSPTILIAGGLRPISNARSGNDMEDLVFLSALYAAGAKDLMPVVSLHLTDLSGEAIASPDSQNPYVLRRYELIRQVMLKQNHTGGLIWITGFSWPDSDSIPPEEQSRWINQAFQLMRSQLYIGAAFVAWFNPPHQTGEGDHHYLIQNKGQETRLHPALYALAQLITLDRSGQLIQPLTELEKTSSSTLQKTGTPAGLP